MDAGQQYNSHIRWMNQVDGLVEKLQNLGDLEGLEKKEQLLKDLSKTVDDAIESYGLSKADSELRRSLELREIFLNLPQDKLISSNSIRRKMSISTEIPAITGILNKTHKNLGVAKIQIGFCKIGHPIYWLKPSDNPVVIQRDLSFQFETDTNQFDLNSLMFLNLALRNHGYCESPNFFREEYLERFDTSGRFGRYGRNRQSTREGYDFFNFKRWLKNGQSTFDTFLGKTNLPTATFDEKIAIVYHPTRLKELQKIKC